MSSAGPGVLTPSQLMNSLGVNPAGGAGLLFSAEMVNYTPLMLGGHDARHYRCLDPGCNTRVPSPGLVAQAIKARARWLARATVATLPDCLDESHRGLEQSCAQVRVRLKGGKELKLGLVELMFGTIRGPQLASPFTLTAKLSTSSPQQGIVTANLSNRRGPYTVYRDTRVEQLLQGKSAEERLLLLPWREGSTRVIVEARLAPHATRLLNSLPASTREVLPCLYAALILATPLVAGIGKAVTRGFGRFKYESISLYNTVLKRICSKNALDELNDIRGALLSLNTAGNRRDAERLLERIIDALRNLWSLASPGTGPASSTAAGALTRVPSFASYKLEVVRIKASSITDAMNCIGKAVRKSTWKSLAGVSTGSGVPFHTWPLGLPRHAEGVKCNCDDGYPKDRAGIYGYIVVPQDVLPSPNHCLPNKHCTGRSGGTVNELASEQVKVGKRLLEAKNVRHPSLVTLSPLPGSPELIAVIRFNSYSINIGVDTNVHKPAANTLTLLHLGGHFTRSKTDGKLRPCCSAHAVEISHVRQNIWIAAPLHQCCGKDPGGIQFPPTRHGQSNRRPGEYRHVLDAAFEWVIEALNRRC